MILKYGNHKLGDDTAIFNMSTAKDCPARKLGMCEVVNKGIKCYAEKAEDQYPNTVPKSRQSQRDYWRNRTANEILQDFAKKIKRRRKTTRFVRFNEAGDFHDQEDVEKLSTIAQGLGTLGITTYGYTSRKDLDFSRASFLVKGSGHTNGNNGTCTVIGRNDKVPDGYIECPGGEKGCSKCNLCKIDTKLNIAFRKH